jgi:hypothetical protein
MNPVDTALSSLRHALDVQRLTFSSSQELHFEWLHSVCFQLRMYEPDQGSTNDTVDLRHTRSLPPATSPVQLRSPVHSPKENSRSYSFDERFPLVLDENPIPTDYEMSDDDNPPSLLVRDDEIYQSDPFEIHGKVIPLWARRENVRRQLRAQQSINGDALFRTLPKIFVA